MFHVPVLAVAATLLASTEVEPIPHASMSTGAAIDPAAEVFFGPGTVGLGPQTCFTFLAETGESFLISDSGGFAPGDEAFIVGTVEHDSQICFPVTGDALVDTTLRPIYSACGTLVHAPQSCLALLTDDGASILVENTNGFMLGDRVCVRGAFEAESSICLPLIGEAVELNTIRALFEGCGELARGPQSCTLLHADSGEIFAVGQTDGFLPGNRVRVTGPIERDSLRCFPFIIDAVVENVIVPCDPLGDLDGDGSVGTGDLTLLLSEWGPCPAPPESCPADLNVDGVVDSIDLLLLIARWS
jgi:hypothetical protein